MLSLPEDVVAIRAKGAHQFGGGHYRMASAPLAIKNPQWPIEACGLGTPEWSARAETMGKALAGASGVNT